MAGEQDWKEWSGTEWASVKITVTLWPELHKELAEQQANDDFAAFQKPMIERVRAQLDEKNVAGIRIEGVPGKVESNGMFVLCEDRYEADWPYFKNDHGVYLYYQIRGGKWCISSKFAPDKVASIAAHLSILRLDASIALGTEKWSNWETVNEKRQWVKHAATLTALSVDEVHLELAQVAAQKESSLDAAHEQLTQVGAVVLSGCLKEVCDGTYYKMSEELVRTTTPSWMRQSAKPRSRVWPKFRNASGLYLLHHHPEDAVHSWNITSDTEKKSGVLAYFVTPPVNTRLLREIFDYFDLDRDGKLNKEEYTQYLCVIPVCDIGSPDGVLDDDWCEWDEKWDIDDWPEGTAGVTWREFETVLYVQYCIDKVHVDVMAVRENKAIREIFGYYDVDKDVKLNQVEYGQYLRGIDLWGTGSYKEETWDKCWATECADLECSADDGVTLKAFETILYAMYRNDALQADLAASRKAHPLNFEDALQYIEQVKSTFEDQPTVYTDFLEIMKDLKSTAIDTPEVIRRVIQLFRGHTQLILGFNGFLPAGYNIREADLGGSVGATADEAVQSDPEPPAVTPGTLPVGSFAWECVKYSVWGETRTEGKSVTLSLLSKDDTAAVIQREEEAAKTAVANVLEQLRDVGAIKLVGKDLKSVRINGVYEPSSDHGKCPCFQNEHGMYLWYSQSAWQTGTSATDNTLHKLKVAAKDGRLPTGSTKWSKIYGHDASTPLSSVSRELEVTCFSGEEAVSVIEKAKADKQRVIDKLVAESLAQLAELDALEVSNFPGTPVHSKIQECTVDVGSFNGKYVPTDEMTARGFPVYKLEGDETVCATVATAFNGEDDAAASQHESLLTLAVRDVVIVTDQSDEDWWKGHIMIKPEVVGSFPAKCVKLMQGGPRFLYPKFRDHESLFGWCFNIEVKPETATHWAGPTDTGWAKGTSKTVGSVPVGEKSFEYFDGDDFSDFIMTIRRRYKPSVDIASKYAKQVAELNAKGSLPELTVSELAQALELTDGNVSNACRNLLEQSAQKARVKLLLEPAQQQATDEVTLAVSGFRSQTVSTYLGKTIAPVELSTFNGKYTYAEGDDTPEGFPVWRRVSTDGDSDELTCKRVLFRHEDRLRPYAPVHWCFKTELKQDERDDDDYPIWSWDTDAETLLKKGREPPGKGAVPIGKMSTWAVNDGHAKGFACFELTITDRNLRNEMLVTEALNGETAAVERVLDEGVDIDTVDKHGRTALYCAAKGNHVGILKAMVAAGSNIDKAAGAGTLGMTPISSALHNSCLAAAECLLEAGADWRKIASEGDTAFTLATTDGKAFLTRWVAMRGTEEDKASMREERFRDAVCTAQMEEVKRMLAEGIDTNVVDAGGRSALFCAAQHCHLEIVSLLIGVGAAVDAPLVTPGSDRTNGLTPLMTAARQTYPKAAAVVEALLQAGADPHKKNGEGRTALDGAKQHKAKKCVAVLKKTWLEKEGQPEPEPEPVK